MEKVAVFGAQKGARKKADDIKLKLNMSGNNFGNYLIGYSVDKQVENCDFFRFSDKLDFESINSNYDRAVIASANFISSEQDLGKWADVLENLDMPITPIGLGAQALSTSDTIKINTGTERWLKIVSEKSVSIGVRGEFTADVLSNLGIKNVDVIGCPSAFMSLDSNFSIDTKLKLDDTSVSQSRILVHGAPRQNQMYYIDFLFDTFGEYDAKFLVQSESKLLKLQAGEIGIDEFKDNYMNMKNRSIPSRQNLVDNAVYFEDVDVWKEYLKTVDFCIGGRFHGNMLAAQMKVPALWIVHDTRTMEFTDLYSFPSVHMDELVKLSKSKILDKFTYEGFNKKYKALYNNYSEFLLKNNIKNKL
tara:strand:+ start:4000 stop:5082 length:1083 start_codon:yes stop_codon:yes gene_type:complete